MRIRLIVLSSLVVTLVLFGPGGTRYVVALSQQSGLPILLDHDQSATAIHTSLPLAVSIRQITDNARPYLPGAGSPSSSPLLPSGRNTSASEAGATYPVTNTAWTRLTTDSYMDIQPAWSPDGTHIAWNRFSNSWNRNIWEMNAGDGSGKTQVTSGSVDEQPHYSPDGQRLAFMRYYNDSRADIVVKELSTGGETAIRSTGYNLGPRWSPDGNKILFYSASSLTAIYHVYTMNPDGSNVTQLTFDGWLNMRPDWSPDGSRVAFDSDRAGAGQGQVSHVYVMDADGSNVMQLVEGGGPDWSPDGNFITFGRNYAPHLGHIYVMRSDGTDIVQFTDSSGENECNPRWSPAGTKILFSAVVSGNMDIYTLDVDLAALYGSTLIASTDGPELYPGDPVSVALTIQNANDLYAAQADCSVDPAILEPQSGTFDGSFFDPLNRLIGANVVSPTLGTWLGAISQRSPAEPLSGDGLFATLTLQATNPGTTTVICDPLLSDRDGFTQTASFTPADITVLPYATITGTVTYQGRLDHTDIVIWATGPVTQTDVTDGDGVFTLIQLRAGTYDIKADVGSYLPSCITSTVAAGDTVVLPQTRLLGGDLNDDETINIGDATLLTANFNEMVPPADARADINDDSIVNVQDLAILGGNYEISGCQEW